MTSYRFVNKFLKIAAMELEIHPPPGFGFNDSTRLAMPKSISTPNFDTIARSTAVLLLLLIWENGNLPYWNHTSGFDLTYWSSRVLAFCIDAPNLKFLAPIVPEIWRGSQNFKSRSREPFPTPFDLICIFFFTTPIDVSACEIWTF